MIVVHIEYFHSVYVKWVTRQLAHTLVSILYIYHMQIERWRGRNFAMACHSRISSGRICSDFLLVRQFLSSVTMIIITVTIIIMNQRAEKCHLYIYMQFILVFQRTIFI